MKPDGQDLTDPATGKLLGAAPDTLSDYPIMPAAPIKPDAQHDLWIAAFTAWPIDADVTASAGWQSSIDYVRDVWTWNVYHSSVPADRASAVLENWCIGARSIKRGKHSNLEILDVLSFISESRCSTVDPQHQLKPLLNSVHADACS
jgi:hypothetical protein